MPFTLTHILAVVPIKQGWLRSAPFSALIIGSLVPDWPLFIPIGPNYATTHSFQGVITACLPLGLLTYLVFHTGLKRPLFEFLPQPLRQRLIVFVESPISLRPMVLMRLGIAVAIGAATHIVWDAFTHHGQWGVQIFPVLDRVVFAIAGLELPGYKLLQYGSTLLGMPVLLMCLARWFQRSQAHPIPPSIVPRGVRKGLILLSVLLPLGISALTVSLLMTSPMSDASLNHIVFEYVTQAGFIFILLMGVYSALFYLFISLKPS